MIPYWITVIVGAFAYAATMWFLPRSKPHYRLLGRRFVAWRYVLSVAAYGALQWSTISWLNSLMILVWLAVVFAYFSMMFPFVYPPDGGRKRRGLRQVAEWVKVRISNVHLNPVPEGAK